MSKRIAFICKGSPLLNKDDNPKKGLKFLDKNVERVSKLLETYGNWEIILIDLKHTTCIKNEIEKIEDIDDNEILFFYTGHGKTNDGNFCLVGEKDDTIYFDTTVLEKKFKHASVSIILDACHSGVDTFTDPVYESFTATYTSLAYEDADMQLSFFTHYFCSFLESYIFANERDFELKNLGDILEGKKNDYFPDNQKPTYFSPPSNIHTKRNTIVYSQKEDELIEKLFEDIETQKNEEEFVQLVSTYIELSAIFYDKSYLEKIKYLYSHNIDNSSRFICILKELKQTDTIQQSINILEPKYSKSECKKIEVLFDTLAIDIHPKNSDYAISFYGQNSSKEQSYTSFSEIVSGSQDKILDKLSEKISELIKLYEFANIKTISLILPNNFLNFDFKKLEINGRKCIVDYDIIVKLRERIDDHTKQLRWKDNWKLYGDNVDKKVSEVSFVFEKSDTLNKINKDTRETYPLMLMNCQISDEISEAIAENGISIVLYQQESFEYKHLYLFKKTLNSIFENNKLENLFVDVNSYIRTNIDENIQKSHISLIWDDPNTLPTNIKNEERDSL